MQTPFSPAEYATISEVFEKFSMNTKRASLAWTTIIQRWKDTDGRFYAYMTACNVAAEVNYVGYPKPLNILSGEA